MGLHEEGERSGDGGRRLAMDDEVIFMLLCIFH
jgi:hypothetical protein